MNSDSHYWIGPPPTAHPEGGFLVAIRAGAPNAPRVWIDMGGSIPKGMDPETWSASVEPKREVFYMRDLWPNTPQKDAA